MNNHSYPYNPKAVIFITLILAAAAGWGGYRELPKPENYEKVSGTVSSTTAVTKEGEDRFTVRVWLEGQEVAYKLSAYVSGAVLGSVELDKGSKVEMLANKKEMEKPFTGLLGNVEPSIEIASLTADGENISTWEQHLAEATRQRQMMRWGMFGVLGLGAMALVFGRKKQAD